MNEFSTNDVTLMTRLNNCHKAAVVVDSTQEEEEENKSIKR